LRQKPQSLNFQPIAGQARNDKNNLQNPNAMKILNKLFLALAFFALGAVQAFSQTYTLVWEDNFEGTQLNPNIWNIEVNGNGGGNNELQYYTSRPDNVSIGIEPVSGKSCLILTAKKETYSGKTCTSGRVNTAGKMEFKYGKIEGRIKLPHTANGLWPAFWMMGGDFFPPANVGWPKCGEIDILEMGSATGITNGTQNRYFNGAFHWGENWPQYSHAQAYTAANSLQDDFHLYTLTWDATSVKMYLDQDINPNVAPYCQMNINGGTDPWQVGRYFHKPFFVLLNLAVGGSFPNINNINNVTALNSSNNYEAKMYIDYIKVYQKGDSGQEFYVAECSPLLRRTINASICEGGSYNFYGTNYTQAVSGIEHRFANAGRCDSVITLNLTVNPFLRRTINASICEGGSYFFYGTNYTQAVSGIEHRFANAGRCDSIVTLNLTVTSINTSVTFENNIFTANQADAQYQWYKGCVNINSPMTPIENATAQTFAPTENGYYSVEITYKNCISFSDCNEFPTLGMDNVFADNISIYPNPVKDELYIVETQNFASLKSIEITDIAGRIIVNYSLLIVNYINVSHLPQGVYFIKIYTDKGVVIKRFIKN